MSIQLQVKREGSLYLRIWMELRAQIEEGIYKPGDQLPSESTLVERYGCSRETVRRALRLLDEEGFILPRQGRGTFVLSRSSRLGKRLPSQMERIFHPKSHLLRKEFVPAEAVEEWVTEAFGLSKDEALVHIQYLQLGDGIPFAIQSVYLLPALCPGILEEDFSSLSQLYEERYQVRLSEAEEVARTSHASPEEAALLEIAPGDPVVIRCRLSLDQKGRAFEALRSVDRGDRFWYHYHLMLDESSWARASLS